MKVTKYNFLDASNQGALIRIEFLLILLMYLIESNWLHFSPLTLSIDPTSNSFIRINNCSMSNSKTNKGKRSQILAEF